MYRADTDLLDCDAPVLVFRTEAPSAVMGPALGAAYGEYINGSTSDA